MNYGCFTKKYPNCKSCMFKDICYLNGFKQNTKKGVRRNDTKKSN